MTSGQNSICPMLSDELTQQYSPYNVLISNSLQDASPTSSCAKENCNYAKVDLFITNVFRGRTMEPPGTVTLIQSYTDSSACNVERNCESHFFINYRVASIDTYLGIWALVCQFNSKSPASTSTRYTKVSGKRHAPTANFCP